MTIAALHTGRVERRLRVPLRTARGTLRVRTALRVRVEDDAGRVGRGEAAPLPGFGAGELAVAARDLAAAGDALPGRSLEQARAWVACAPKDPGAAWALDAALAELAARRAGCSVAAWLAQGGSAAVEVPVNALLVARDPGDLEVEARGAAARGERCLKLKVGTGSLADDVARVAAARAGAGPGVALRVDANGVWDLAEARRRLEALRPFALEYVEQPLRAHDLSGLRRLRSETYVAIAADESVRSVADARRVLDEEAADLLVLKPAALGRLDVTRDITEAARARGIDVVLSSLVEAAASLWAALHLAAALGCTRPCGLATGGLLDDDPGSPRSERGLIRIPDGPGLYEPDA